MCYKGICTLNCQALSEGREVIGEDIKSVHGKENYIKTWVYQTRQSN